MTREEMEAALKIQDKLDRKRAALDSLEAGGYKSSLGGVRCGRKASTVAQDAAEIAEEIKELERELEIEQEIIRRAIEKAPLDQNERKLMLLRYVKCREWEEIYIGFCLRHNYRIHVRAMKKVVDDG